MLKFTVHSLLHKQSLCPCVKTKCSSIIMYMYMQVYECNKNGATGIYTKWVYSCMALRLSM